MHSQRRSLLIIVALMIMALGITAGVYVTGHQQDIRNYAAGCGWNGQCKSEGLGCGFRSVCDYTICCKSGLECLPDPSDPNGMPKCQHPPLVTPTPLHPSSTPTPTNSPVVIPNCTLTAAATTITVGQTATFTADFTSPQGNLGGQIFHDGSFTPLLCTNCSTNGVMQFGAAANNGTHSWTWTPASSDVGVHTVYCRAWNDAIAECRPQNLVDGPPRFACAGPNVSIAVSVIPTQGSEDYCHQFNQQSCPAGLCIVTHSCPDCTDFTCHYINHAIPTPTNVPNNTPTNTPINTPTNTPVNTPTPTSGTGGANVFFSPTPTRQTTPTPTGLFSFLPTVRPTSFLVSTESSSFLPTPEPTPPSLSVNPFTNANKEAPSKFTLAGTASPNAQITIEISPDGVFGTATADENGQWRFIITNPLTPGQKELKVTATDVNGVSTTYTESFSVAKSGLGAWIWTVLGLVAAIIVFILIRRRMNQPPPYYPPTTSGGIESNPLVPQEQQTTPDNAPMWQQEGSGEAAPPATDQPGPPAY